MQWFKKLSKSDAQQETEGGLMPFRFIQENCSGNFVSWFRGKFFKELDWENTTWRDYQLEEADIRLSVQILGEDLGQREMKLNHAKRRNKNNNAPATHLRFDEVTREYLQDHDTTGKWIVFSKDSAGGFNLVIQDDKPQKIR